MESRTYTERSNARRAARAAGIDIETITEGEDGFTVNFGEMTTETVVEQKPKATDVTDISWSEMTGADLRKPEAPLDGIPDFCKISPEKRKESWIKNPPKAAAANLRKAQELTMAKNAKAKKPKGEKGADKTTTLLKMLGGKGSTVEAMCKALDWLPHTLRARISRLPKPKTKGGEGLKIERERVDGVTTYRVA